MESPDEGEDAELLLPATELTLDSLPGYSESPPASLSRWWWPLEPEVLAAQEVVKDEGISEEMQMVLEQMVTVERTLTADNTDFLAGTQLDQPGVPGVYTIWGASTVGDTEITVSLGGRRLTDAAIVTLRANSEIRENEDTFFQVLSRTGGRPLININVVTAATVRVRVKFIPGMLT